MNTDLNGKDMPKMAYRIITIFAFLICLSASTICQDFLQNLMCGTPDSIIHFNGPIGTQTIPVALVYLDFTDGRINGQIPTTDQQLNEVANLDAVLNMGYITTNGGQSYSKIVRKYTYNDFWNMYFSENTFVEDAHPDWSSHGQYGFPPDQDPAVAFGSFREYYSEVSYGKLTISAPLTHSEEEGMYRTGIVNDILEVNGRKIIKPIMLNASKKYHYTIPGTFGQEIVGFNNILVDAHNLLVQMYNNQEIKFNIQSHLNNGGRILYVFAGSSSHVGGLTDEKECVVREKRITNGFDTEYDKYRIINGLTISCHEFGHTLGLTHPRVGNYDVMSEGTLNQSCPSYLNIIYRLKLGWIDQQYVHRYKTNQIYSNLPPSSYNGECVVYTIYGDGGYSDPNSPPNYKHSEYYVLENRRMLSEKKFDKRFVYQSGTYPPGFNGGCLITHYSNYNSMVEGGAGIKIISADPDPEMEVQITDEGHSRHFFGVPVYEHDPYTTLLDNADPQLNRTKSSFNLRTGINISNIIQSNGNINFTFTYSLGEPPVYDRIFYGQNLTEALTLNGLYFIDELRTTNDFVIQPGTVIESPKGKVYYTGSSSKLSWVGSSSSPIIFRGAGYSTYYTSTVSIISVTNNSNPNTEPTAIKYCNFTLYSPIGLLITNNNSNSGSVHLENCNTFGSGEFQVNISNQNSDIPINIEEIQVQGNGNFSINIGNPNNALNVNNITITGQDRVLYLHSSYEIRSKLGSLANSNFKDLKLAGLWQFDIDNDIEINQDGTFSVNDLGDGCCTDIQFTTPYKFIINGSSYIEGGFTINRDFLIGQTGTAQFLSASMPENYVRFTSGTGIICEGALTINGGTQNLYLMTNGTGIWNGIVCQNPGNISVNNAKIMNAVTGLEVDNPQGGVTIQYSQFSDNTNYDILINNFGQSSEEPRLIKNNVFVGNENKVCAIYCNNGVDINIQDNNQFEDDYNVGISLTYVTNPVIKQNTFLATTEPAYSPKGIYAYSSGGFFSCNDMTNYSNAVELNNSSPYLFNNDIYNNGIGLYCVSASYPILTPAYSPGGTLYIGGYNRIHDNLEAEIHCENTIFIPSSLPVLGDGYNSIYDNNTDCLIDLTGISTPIEYNVQNNFWGGGSPQNRLCPPSFTFVYEPYLSEEPQPPPYCEPQLQSANNSGMSQYTLQLGTANIDDYNGNLNSAVTKYKNLITFTNNPSKSYLLLSKIFYSTSKDTNADFYSLENYYSSLSNQYSTDTLFRRKSANVSTSADVEQPSYQEAIGEYQAIIDNPLNQVERHYAYIDQMRTIRLMLDSLLNGSGNGPMGGNYNRNEFKLLIQTLLNFKLPESSSSSDKNQDQKDKLNVTQKTENAGKLVSRLTSKDKNAQLNNIRKTLNIENITFDNLSNHDKVKLLDNVLAFKLLEFSLLYNSPNERPLTRMSLQKRSSAQVSINIPKVFKLYQNYPNPFNPLCAIKFDIPKESMVTIKIYDLLGREVTTLVNEVRQGGYYQAFFDGSNYASGVYFYRIEARQVGLLTGGYVNVKKMVLMK